MSPAAGGGAAAHADPQATTPAAAPTQTPDVASPPSAAGPSLDLAHGAWPVARRQELLAKTRRLTLTPDLSVLSAAERACLAKLLEVGPLLQEISERSLHKDADRVRQALQAPNAPEDLRALFRLFSGPIATTLDNQRQAFVDVAGEVPGKNFYPSGVSKPEIEAYLGQHPNERAALLDIRTLVRRADAESLTADLATLERHPVLAALHPEVRKMLLERQAALRTAPKSGQVTGFYAVPFAIGYGDDLVKAHDLLDAAATLVQPEDAEFARYLKNRARDLLSNDYESGDASWVTGRFKRLNAEIGSYETYDDQLYGAKASTALSVLLKDVPRTEKLQAAIKDLQSIEDSLPYDHHKRVRSDISIGIYDVVADFGQARGLNTATILPNDPEFSRKYGRTILLRANIMQHPDLFVSASGKWRAAVTEPFVGDLTIDGGFYRTLWHEIGHYLGVATTRDGRSLDVALEENESTFEELKSDLVALYAVKALSKSGYYNASQARSVYADGIRRTLLLVKPRRDQPYQTMMLMQLNYFLENGLLKLEPKSGRLVIHYAAYHQVVSKMLRLVLEVQYQGDKAASNGFIERYTQWREELHGGLAAKLRAQEDYRYALVHYAAID